MPIKMLCRYSLSTFFIQFTSMLLTFTSFGSNELLRDEYNRMSIEDRGHFDKTRSIKCEMPFLTPAISLEEFKN